MNYCPYCSMHRNNKCIGFSPCWNVTDCDTHPHSWGDHIMTELFLQIPHLKKNHMTGSHIWGALHLNRTRCRCHYLWQANCFQYPVTMLTCNVAIAELGWRRRKRNYPRASRRVSHSSTSELHTSSCWMCSPSPNTEHRIACTYAVCAFASCKQVTCVCGSFCKTLTSFLTVVTNIWQAWDIYDNK
jgi:hypothetical protein